MKNKFTISGSVLYPYLHTIRSMNLDEDLIWKECGIDSSILTSTENRFSLHQYDLLIKKAVELSGDNAFGIRLGKAFSIGSGNIVTFMIQNCSTLRDAITKYIEYQEIVGEAIKFKLLIEREDAIITLSFADSLYLTNRHILEAEMVAIYNIGRQMVATELKLKEVQFHGSEPENQDLYQNIFNCQMKWNMPISALRFHKKQLDALLKQPNQELLLLLEKQALSILKQHKNTESFSDKVSRILDTMDFNKMIRIELVAQKIPISVRALQMKLKAEGTGFQKIVDNVRQEKATSQLRCNTAITEIAYSLGFSEPAAFQKAFRKWTGMSPGEFRNKK